LQGCKPAVCLYALQKRRIQPERYVQYALNFVENFEKELDKKYSRDIIIYGGMLWKI
jgi:hypothetical protein